MAALDPATVDLVVPAHDEAAVLAANVERLHRHLVHDFPHRWQVTIADSASTDATRAIARSLAATLPQVRTVELDEPGRGRALRAAWTSSDADVLAYMDADLSTDLGALRPLVDEVASGRADLATGSRLIPGADVERGLRRASISRAYNLLVRSTLRLGVRDAQCGFKAISAPAATKLLPLVRDDHWFFDTELLVLAQRAGLRTAEVPVRWVDDPDSSVRLLATAVADLRGVARLALAHRAGRP